MSKSIGIKSFYDGFDPNYIGPFKLIPICLIEFRIFSFCLYIELKKALWIYFANGYVDSAYASIWRDSIKIKIHTPGVVSTDSYGINSYGHVLFMGIK